MPLVVTKSEITKRLTDSGWRDLLVRIENDNKSGASEIALKCAALLTSYSDSPPTDNAILLSRDLIEIATRIMRIHGSMAPVIRLLNEVLCGITDTETTRSLLDHVRRVANEHIALMEQVGALLASQVATFLPANCTIVTLSNSNAIARGLAAASTNGSRLKVICLESRPMLEGRDFAKVIARRVAEVWLIADAAAGEAVKEATIILLGADALTIDGVWNKAGSYLLSLAGREASVPVYVIADTSKIWPAGLSRPAPKYANPGELWARSPGNVGIRNVYFELLPWYLCTGIITERGLIDPASISSVSATHTACKLVAEIMSQLSSPEEDPTKS